MILMVALAILAVALVALVLHAELFRRQVEARYPPLGEFVTVEGLKLHYVERGEGPPVILLHGDSGSTYDYTMSPLFARLAQKYRVLAFDRPGLGYSERPKREGWSPFVQARLVRAAAAQLGIERPVVAGHSRGGAALFAWALEDPDGLAGAVGLAPAAYPGGVSIYRLMSVPLLGDLLFYALVYPFERFGITRITRQSLDVAFAPDRPPPAEYAGLFVSLWLRRRHCKAAMEDIAYAGERTGQMAARYGEIRVPFVVVNGEADHNVSPEWARRLERINPRVKAILLPGTGHELMFNRPDEVARAVDLVWEMAARPEP